VSHHLIDLMRSTIVVEGKLQVELDKLVPPTTTGYMHREESWTIAWVRPGDDDTKIEMALDPPSGAHEWNWPTAEKMQTLQTQLSCDYLKAFAHKGGEVRYIATWDQGAV
jgi:hypothetical protein